ncbi:ABC transporter permease [Oceanithermus desulfurans]|uniref:ABC transporter permease n=2 Tax=Oceanithermus desulfurans TaxID=227924 RepID=A0A511RIA3_9DEIN|nr:ABC transporter permease [Oceanithermus desulfurans]MBB6030904.1 ABC-type antimicrobial peptide transport system permease subunit [Oceanithermus desulfurans]GEM88576.1 hypothetical protein ODE01S_00100 [Oceanithermus desulfurans NBRC 100063]
MSTTVRLLRAAVTLAATALAAALLLLGLSAYQHAQSELESLMRVVGRDVLMLERDWSQRGVIVTPDFVDALRAFATELDGFEALALRASGGRSPNRFDYYHASVTPEYFPVRHYPLAKGRLFAPGSCEAVAGYDHADLLGRRIKVRGVEVHVVGVLEPVSRRGGPDRYVDGTVFVPYDLKGPTVPMEVYIKFSSERALEAAWPQIVRWLEAGGYPYVTRPLADLFGVELRRQLREVLGGALLWGLLAALLTAGVNLSAYSLARALEQIRALGIRRAVGATARDLLHETTYSSLAWALAGYTLGVGLGFGLAGWFMRETGLQATPTLSSVVFVGLGIGALAVVSAYPAARWSASQPPAGAVRGIASSLPQRRQALAFVGLVLGLAAYGAQLGITSSAEEHARRVVGDLSSSTAIYSSFLYLRQQSLTDPRGAVPLNYNDYLALRTSELARGIRRSAFVENYRIELTGPEGKVETYLRAYEGPYPVLGGARPFLGRWPLPGEGELALGRRLAERLYGRPKEALSQELSAFGRRWMVVGVFAGAARPAPGNAADDQALLPRADLKRTLPGARAEILVEKKPGASEQVFTEIGQFLTARHLDFGLHPVQPLRRNDLVPELRSVLMRLAAAYRLLAFTILVLAGAGLMAQTLVSVQRRMRELGIRRATGATKTQMFLELLAPLGIGAMLAGLLGALLGLGAAYAVVRLHEATWSLPWAQLLLAPMAAPLLSALAAALPAWQAVSVPPAEAMRSE